MPTISVHVDEATFKLVGDLADQMDRSKSWVVSDALTPYLDHQRWMVERTTKALEDLRAGKIETIPHDEAIKRIRDNARKLDEERKLR